MFFNYASLLRKKKMFLYFSSSALQSCSQSLSAFLCLFRYRSISRRSLSSLCPPVNSSLLRFPLPYITCRKSKHGKNEGKRMSVSGVAYKHLISHRGVPFSLFSPPLLLLWCKSTRLTECSKCSGSKKSTLLF